MPQTVFWSWQSDRPGKVNRHFLRDVVNRAIAQAAEGMDVEERPEIDQDGLGTAGIVSIPETILAKIDAAAVFVADLTPVAFTDAGKPVANPNVLIELGYAKKALGPERIVLVWNGAWGGCAPEDLPFDLRHRRAPFRYDLDAGIEKKERERVAAKLVSDLGLAIRASLGRVPAVPVPAIARIPARADDRSVWFEQAQEIVVASGRMSGPETLLILESARSYIRIAPSEWGTSKLTGVTEGRHDIMPLGDLTGLSWGRTRGGVIAYETAERQDGKAVVRHATQWFASNGEIWGFDGHVTYGIDRANAGLAVDYIIQCWRRFLLRHARTMADHGARGPYEVEAGVTGFEDLRWPPSRYKYALNPAIEAEIIERQSIPSLAAERIDAFVRAAADQIRHAYGFEPFDDARFSVIMADSRAQV